MIKGIPTITIVPNNVVVLSVALSLFFGFGGPSPEFVVMLLFLLLLKLLCLLLCC